MGVVCRMEFALPVPGGVAVAAVAGSSSAVDDAASWVACHRTVPYRRAWAAYRRADKGMRSEVILQSLLFHLINMA